MNNSIPLYPQLRSLKLRFFLTKTSWRRGFFVAAIKLAPLEETCEIDIAFLTCEVVRGVSKAWTLADWENYLKHLDYKTPEEEMYVGTPKELERFIEKQTRKLLSRKCSAKARADSGSSEAEEDE
jgi:hypothetical protein